MLADVHACDLHGGLPPGNAWQIIRAPVVAVYGKDHITDAASERRAAQCGLFTQRAREKNAVEIRTVARFDALRKYRDDQLAALSAPVVERAELPRDAEALPRFHRADAQQRFACHDDGHVALPREALHPQREFIEPAGMVLVRKNRVRS